MRLALNLSARGVDGTRTARFFRDGLEVAVFVDIKDDGSDSLDSTDDDSDDEERGRTGPTRR